MCIREPTTQIDTRHSQTDAEATSWEIAQGKFAHTSHRFDDI